MNDIEEPRVMVIDGHRVRVYERTPPLPPTLSLLFDGGRDAKGRLWQPLRVVRTKPLGKLGGARVECMADDHRLRSWIDGFHVGSDLVTRSLHINVCADCGSVCVRDASYDVLDRLPTGGRPLRRKDHVIGWYSGARPNQREYRG
jgi:hypothetical protein